MEFLAKIDPYSYTTSAFIIGLLLIDNLTPAEQNSVGNWFMMIGQVLETSASQQQVINNYSNSNSNSNSNTSNSSNNHIVNDNIQSIKKAVNIINENIKNI